MPASGDSEEGNDSGTEGSESEDGVEPPLGRKRPGVQYSVRSRTYSRYKTNGHLFEGVGPGGPNATIG